MQHPLTGVLEQFPVAVLQLSVVQTLPSLQSAADAQHPGTGAC
jgi:hypothetical protein